MVALKNMEKEHGWPEIVLYVSDELSNEGPPAASGESAISNASTKSRRRFPAASAPALP